MPEPTLAQLHAWVSRADAMVKAHYAKHFPLSAPDNLQLRVGKKFGKIISFKRDEAGNSAWGFIDLSNGDVLKAESWKRPAPHARGNIFTDEPADCCEWTGPRYLR